MRLSILIFFSLLVDNLSFGQMSPSEYLDRCDSVYQEYVARLPQEQKAGWKKKLVNLKVSSINKTAGIEENRAIYRESNLEHLLAFQYLNALYDYMLPAETDLLNELGKEVFVTPHRSLIELRLDSLKADLTLYSNSENADKLTQLYRRFLTVEKNLESSLERLDTFFYYKYQPKENVYSQPYKTETYVVYDWRGMKNHFDKIRDELDSIEVGFAAARFEFIKDPYPIFPFVGQFAALLVAVVSLLVNFGFEAKIRPIAFGVFLSVIVSVVLIVLNPDTFFNTVMSILVPGGLYLIYYLKNKRRISPKAIVKLRTFKNRYRRLSNRRGRF